MESWIEHLTLYQDYFYVDVYEVRQPFTFTNDYINQNLFLTKFFLPVFSLIPTIKPLTLVDFVLNTNEEEIKSINFSKQIMYLNL